MWYLISTKRGLGVELWGSYDDLNNLYDVIGKFWNKDEFLNKKGFASRDQVISGFSYEIRKAKDGQRLTRKHSHFSLEPIPHFGAEISWVHFLFSLSALRYNMRYMEANKFDLATFLQIEYWLASAMYKFDAACAATLERFIGDSINGGNDYLYQYMRSINYDFFLMGGGIRAFRKLPQLLQRAVIYSNHYKDYMAFLESEAKRLNCSIEEIEIDDDAFDYDSLKW